MYVDPYIDGKTEVVTETGTAVEIALLGTLKGYLGITGTSQDALLTLLLGASRQMVEKLSGIYFQPRTVKLYAAEWIGRHKLPYGAFSGTLTVHKNNGVTVTNTDWSVKGTGARTLYSATTDGLEIEYATTGQTLSDLAKLAILKEALTQYEARMNVVIGSISGKINGSTADICRLLRSEA